MRRTIATTICLLLMAATPGLAQEQGPTFLNTQDTVPWAQYARMNAAMLGGGGAAAVACADTSCIGFLICQNFEETVEACTTCVESNSETWVDTVGAGSTVNEDGTTVVLRGSDTLEVTFGGTGAAQTRNNPAFTAADTVYAHFLYQRSSMSAAGNIFKLLDSGATAVATVNIATTGKLRIYHGAAASSYTTDALSEDTTYHIWVYYTKDAATNDTGVASVEFTAVGTRTPVGSGDKYTKTEVGAADNQASFALPCELGNAMSSYFDQILVKTTAIGTVCE